MKNGKSRTRFAFIKILDANGDVVERFAIDSKGKPVLQSKAEEIKEFKSIESIKPIPKIAARKPLPPVEIEPVLSLENDGFNHWNHIEDDFIIRDYDQLQPELTFDFETDLALRSAIELLPDPFFL